MISLEAKCVCVCVEVFQGCCCAMVCLHVRKLPYKEGQLIKMKQLLMK